MLADDEFDPDLYEILRMSKGRFITLEEPIEQKLLLKSLKRKKSRLKLKKAYLFKEGPKTSIESNICRGRKSII